MTDEDVNRELWGFFWRGVVAILLCYAYPCYMAWNIVHASERVARWAPTVAREAQAVFGINAPVPALLGQIHQESGGRENVTAWDNGRGLAQFMDATARDVSRRHPELGSPNPYNPTWAIRAMVRLNWDNYRAVKGKNPCEKWGGAFKGYNAGVGYVLQAQAKSPDPETWFGVTEHVKTRQSPKNFEYSRLYSHWILFKHQPLYARFGPAMCMQEVK